jgi:hypothetical protein
MVRSKLTTGLCLAAYLILAAAPAQAHRAGVGRIDGLAIESLSHGQMTVIARNRAAVFALAANTAQTDDSFRRLFNYAKIQRTVCLWGIVPGSVSDEQNPFNGCAHAYLAATRALLNHMRARPGADPAAIALADDVDHQLLVDGTLELCAYSGEPYNTADLIYPEWSAMSAHPPSVLAGGGLLGIVGVGSLLAWRRRSRLSAPG